MEYTLDELVAELASLIREAEGVPGYSGRFGARPRVSRKGLTQFEASHGVVLPVEYREFLLRVGNGGRWPHLVQEGFGGLETPPWKSWDFRPGAISEPFPHTHGWNDPSGEPAYRDELDGDPAFERRDLDWKRRYFSKALLSGAIPLNDNGCGRCSWLVVIGPLAGTVWYDCRVDRLGIYPITDSNGMWVRFTGWMLLRVDYARRWLRRERNRSEQS
ncbi:Cell wall assembly and cell proliferation coordinating protein OS=Rhodopirellula maiorica SM1 GN=RMSM_00541 PE=4 SV=1 [Gemmataceae bacterium]|nr:Cell wall assembly and cell proliferation coordinating protein OS=Rhodopirellula maiorica SM1 GN=RMSM_00541 PE=4 SV=1 [Gemmataceae bacterium]VTT99469.1 Cell wall assembly and cell proliferation coordinating protein OS=Rhodopirellula maiorica SM1 GN=RMSM_00541 PE=4 SV=1 [Gemmataceae bacterium]